MNEHTANFILRRYDRNPQISYVIAGYTERATSIPFEVSGVLANTMFIRDKGTRDIALQSGWKDETQMVRSYLENKKSIEEESVIIEKPKRGRPRKK